MKAFLLSAFVVVAFIVYALAQKFTGGILPGPFSASPTPTQTTQVPTPTSSPTPTTVANKGTYKDGSYTGDVIDANYGNVQVKATIAGGKISNVEFLSYPSDRTTSQKINNRAMPILIQEAITTQVANVDAVTGASFTSAAFVKSLQSALDKAMI